MEHNVLNYLDNAAQAWSDRAAFTDEREAMTFSGLRQASRAVGSALTAYTSPRDSVAVLMNDRSAACVAGMLGVVQAGCAYSPLDASMPTERLQVIFDQLKPAAILCDATTRQAVHNAAPACPAVMYEDAVATPVDDARLAEIRAQAKGSDILSILFTSGSTGVPKGVAQSQRSYVNYVETNTERFGFTIDDVYANQSPFFYANSITDLYPALKFGATVYIMPSRCLSFPRMLVEMLKERKVTVLCMTPSSYVKAAQSGVMEPGCLPALKYIVLSGEAAHWQTLEVWLSAAPNAAVWNFYGSTEMMGVAVKRLVRTYSDSELIPVGMLYKGVEILLMDDEGNEIPREKQGEKGEMYITSPWLFSGYYRDELRTEAAFVTDPLGCGRDVRYYRTGDIGSFSPEGELLVHGRKDSQIKRAGYRMELGEVEAALRIIPGWENGLMLYDKESGKLACFWTGPLTKKEIMAELKKTLPRYAQPDTYVHLDEMPYTATMKIDREKLRKML